MPKEPKQKGEIKTVQDRLLSPVDMSSKPHKSIVLR